MVLKSKTAKEATSDILATHCIPSAMSGDLKTWKNIEEKVWKSTPLYLFLCNLFLNEIILYYNTAMFLFNFKTV